MAKLNEDVLRLIFDYLETPLEWIQVSEVCQLWKSAASKQWRKIDKIAYCNDKIAERERFRAAMMAVGETMKKDYYPEITAKNAERIVKCAAPFVRILTTSTDRWFEKDNGKDQFIEFGPFLYKVIDYNSETMLKLLAENATKITEVKFDEPPGPELLQNLINGNNIKKFDIKRCQNFYEHVSTDEIEELETFLNKAVITPFKGHFPNLKKLQLELVVYSWLPRPRQMLSPILPHVLGLTSFSLSFYHPVYPKPSISCKILMDIAKISQIEQLAIHFNSFKVTAIDSFIKKLAKGCPKLRLVVFDGMEITEKQICTLLSLLNLDSLTVDTVLSFRSIELPETLNLTNLAMTYDCAKFDITIFCDALRKMPKLEYLEMQVDYLTEHDRSGLFFNYDETYKLVCQVILVAVSQNKDVLVLNKFVLVPNKISDKKFKITRKNADSLDTTTQTLNLTVSVSKEQTLLQDITIFVQNNFEGYNVAMV